MASSTARRAAPPDGAQREEGHGQAVAIGDPAGERGAESGAEAGGKAEGADGNVEEPCFRVGSTAVSGIITPMRL